jgi:hypothetical protein
MERLYRNLFFGLIMSFAAGCAAASDPIARLSVTTNGTTTEYLSYKPSNLSSERGPMCSWRSEKTALVTAEGKRIPYDSISLACSFDVNDESKIEYKYGISIEFRSFDQKPFEVALVVLNTSEDGSILKSNLMDGDPPGWQCKSKNCGISFAKLDLPDINSKTGDLAFDMSFSAPVTDNLSDEVVKVLDIRMAGAAKSPFQF